MINNKIKVQIVLCVRVCLFLNLLKMSKVRGWRGEVGGCGVGEGGHGSLPWPELALAAPVLTGDSDGAGVGGGGEGEPCAHRATYLKPCWFQAWP